MTLEGSNTSSPRKDRGILRFPNTACSRDCVSRMISWKYASRGTSRTVCHIAWIRLRLRLWTTLPSPSIHVIHVGDQSTPSQVYGWYTTDAPFLCSKYRYNMYAQSVYVHTLEVFVPATRNNQDVRKTEDTVVGLDAIPVEPARTHVVQTTRPMTDDYLLSRMPDKR